MTDHEPHPPLGAERRAHVMAVLGRDGVVRIAQLMDELNVAPVTLRRDLAQMEQEGLLVRVHGGAVPVEGAAPARRRAGSGRRVDRHAGALAQLLLAGRRARSRGRGQAPRDGIRAAGGVVRAPGRAPGAGAADPHRECEGPHRGAEYRHGPRPGRHPVARGVRHPQRARRARRRPPAGGRTGRIRHHRPCPRRRARRSPPRVPRPPQGGPDHLARLADLPQDHGGLARGIRGTRPDTHRPLRVDSSAADEPGVLLGRGCRARFRLWRQESPHSWSTPTPRPWPSSISP